MAAVQDVCQRGVCESEGQDLQDDQSLREPKVDPGRGWYVFVVRLRVIVRRFTLYEPGKTTTPEDETVTWRRGGGGEREHYILFYYVVRSRE